MMRIEIFTDGACSGNPGKGGYGVVMEVPNSNYKKEFYDKIQAKEIKPFEFDINSIKDDEDNLIMLANLRQKLKLLEPVSDCIIMKKPLCTLLGHNDLINELISETWANYADEINICVNCDGSMFFVDYLTIKETPDLKTYVVKQILKKMKEINKCN